MQIRSQFRKMSEWVACSILTGLISFVGIAFGSAFLRPGDPVDFIKSISRMDGGNYRSISANGYEYRERAPALVAFFPAYPVASRWVARATGLSTMSALLLVSNSCCIAAFVLMGVYLETRRLNGERLGPANGYALLAMGLLPTTFFFRMPYSESMFLLLAVLALYGMEKGWPLVVIALVVGLITAVRPVGVALLLPFLWYIWRRSDSIKAFVLRVGCLAPIACWGLESYMAFQLHRFGTPFAFAINQKYHRMRPIGPFSDEFLALVSWEPIRDVYNRSSEGYWKALDYAPYPVFSFIFVSPLYFMGTAAITVLGFMKRWLTDYEVLLAIPLLAIPYCTRAYEMRMMSQARFAAVVFPVYIVLGRLLSRLPPAVAASLLALSGAVMGFYAAIFSTGRHSFF